MKAMAFGKYAIPEAQDYVDSGFQTMSADQTAVYDNLRKYQDVDARTAYGAVQTLSGIEAVKDADGNTIKTTKQAQRDALFAMDGMTPAQKQALDRMMLVGSEAGTPADYSDRTKFMISNYVAEHQQAAAQAAVDDGLSIDSFIQYADALKEEKSKTDEAGDTVPESTAQEQTLNRILQDSSLDQTAKDGLITHVLIDGMSDNRKAAWQDTLKGTISAEQFVRFADKYAEIKRQNEGVEDQAQVSATNFSYYLDGVGLNADARAKVDDSFKYYMMFPAEPKAYSYDMLTSKNEVAYRDAAQDSGVDFETYAAIKEFKGEQTGAVKDKTVSHMREMGLTQAQIKNIGRMFGWKM